LVIEKMTAREREGVRIYHLKTGIWDYMAPSCVFQTKIFLKVLRRGVTLQREGAREKQARERFVAPLAVTDGTKTVGCCDLRKGEEGERWWASSERIKRLAGHRSLFIERSARKARWEGGENEECKQKMGRVIGREDGKILGMVFLK